MFWTYLPPGYTWAPKHLGRKQRPPEHCCRGQYSTQGNRARIREYIIDNFDNKSFDFARRKIIVQTKIEHFKGKEVTDIVKFKCEKIEGKKF